MFKKHSLAVSVVKNPTETAETDYSAILDRLPTLKDATIAVVATVASVYALHTLSTIAINIAPKR